MKWILRPKCCLVMRTRYFSCGLPLTSWSSERVRLTFINYFKDKGHVFVPSSSTVPRKGDGTYFTNAGMNQFKPVILGELDPGSKFQNLVRAVNSQKCIRVGGKHNDLDDVGHDLTHHTFFEMLGNWSFGDYFKTDACQMAYELLTKHYGIPTERLYFTYFAGDEHLNLPTDEDCRKVWLSLGIPESQVLPFGTKDNFWDMGLTGPCGPCTEIHFDHVGNRDASLEVNTGSPDVVEIWNLVFMQYNRQKDQSLKQLRTFHVDTGMGLERMTAVLNGTADNYSTDLFLPLFEVIQKLSSCPPYSSDNDIINTSYRILADHSRMFTVAISDGLLPNQFSLGHKLRTILHRCLHLCRSVFNVEPVVLLPHLISVVVHSLGGTYPEIREAEQRVCEVVIAAVEHHDKQREQAIKSFNKMLARSGHIRNLSGEIIAALEQGTYGYPVPVDLIVELAGIHGLILDKTGSDKLQMDRKMNTSSDPLTVSPDASSNLVSDLISHQVPPTYDVFKYHYTAVDEREYDFSAMYEAVSPSSVLGLSSNGNIISSLQEGDSGEVILNNTCFYAESGGQEADSGKLVSESGEFQVNDVQHQRGYVVHYGHMIKGNLQIGQHVTPIISEANRKGCMCNHTATHLLNSALTKFIPSTKQQGSSVTPYKLYFDFHSLTPVESSLVSMVEEDVKNIIRQEFQVTRSVMPLDLALKLPNVKTLQNEEYPSEVSVITIGAHDDSILVSTELCGGTHVVNTSHLGNLCVTNVTTKSHNVKRMTCVTGDAADQAQCQGNVVLSMCSLLQSLIEYKDVPEKDLEQIMSLTQKTVKLIDLVVERLEHSLTYECEDKSRLRDLIEENDKAKDLCQTFLVTIEQLIDRSVPYEEVMKQLVHFLNKARQMDLIPKTVRDHSHTCLHNLECKVAEAVTKRNISVLQQMLDTEMEAFSGMSSVVLQVDHVDINTRQMVKALSQKGWNRPVILVQKSSKIVQVVVSIPQSLDKNCSEVTLDKTLEWLNHFGKTKSKLSSEKRNTAVYTVTVQTDADSFSVVQRLQKKCVLTDDCL